MFNNPFENIRRAVLLWLKMEINILFEEGYERCIEESCLKNMVEKVLIAQNVDSNVEVSLVLAGQERVHRLNLSYLGRDAPTDVLAFTMLPEPSGRDVAPFVIPPDGIKHLGEVIISYPQAVIQAEEHHHSIKTEIAILIIHGVLHLLGYDHDRPELEGEMRAREAEILTDIEGELK